MHLHEGREKKKAMEIEIGGWVQPHTKRRLSHVKVVVIGASAVNLKRAGDYF